MKGISPVIATVLLIAIAVIGAVALWYWAGGLAGKPPMAQTTQQAITISDCKVTNPGQVNNSAQLTIRNTGGVDVSVTNVGVYLGGEEIAKFDVTVAVGQLATVTMNADSNKNISTGVVYKVIHGQLPEITFSCHN
ncbi:MAG: archaellin/type IV pilin N-terminal domain-containing protein [archaeon]